MRHPNTLQLGAMIILVFCIGLLLRHEVVSPETTLESGRSVFQVKQGTSSDGNLSITEMDFDDPVAPSRMNMNLPRSLRAWSLSSEDGHELVIMVTQISPRRTFMIRGNFLVTPESVHLAWRKSTELMFCGTDQQSTYRWMVIDLRNTSLVPLSISNECSVPELRKRTRPFTSTTTGYETE